ncbi:MAG: ABC transporter ATP-binding protein [Sedimentisphaerales bacterium]|nr:ABC transporter ATP-binding protein [Sedimentisphaerales bacterium]
MVADAICIDGISKRFGRIQALQSVAFAVPAHSIFGLLGPNGAGKTTLFSIVANFLKADAGRVEVLETDARQASLLQGRLNILPQDAQFQRNVPILDQLVFFRELEGSSRAQARDEVRQTLKQVGLESYAKRRVGSLSHGMIKRLGIAQAFLGTPEVILLDEPTSGLDPANARQIRDLIKQLQARATIVVSSHNLAEIQELCDHVAILDHGKLVFAGSVDQINRADCEYQLTLSRALQPDEGQRITALDGIRQIKTAPAATTADAEGSCDYLVTFETAQDDRDLDASIAALLRALLDMEAVPRSLSRGRSLEKHFLEVTKSANHTENNPATPDNPPDTNTRP